VNHKATLDGRSLWIELLNLDEVQDSKQLSISAARSAIATTYFTYESVTFTDYCSNHMAAINVLLQRGVRMHAVSQVGGLRQGIKVLELMAVKSNVIMNPLTVEDLKKGQNPF